MPGTRRMIIIEDCMSCRPEYSNGKSSLRSSLFEALRDKKEGLSSDELGVAVKADNTVDGAGEVMAGHYCTALSH